MPTNGTTQSAPANLPGFDCNTKLTASTCQAFAQAGFRFVVRYVSRGTESSGDLTLSETQAILASGLALMAVQHVLSPGWVPTQALGQQYGQAAAQNAQSAGVIPGINLWLDLEGVAAGTAASDVIAYCNAWFAAVATAGYLPGLYVGTACILNSQQLYSDLTCKFYWKSGSNVPTPAVRGFCLAQTISNSFVLDGVAYDKDITEVDGKGSTPVWMIAV